MVLKQITRYILVGLVNLTVDYTVLNFCILLLKMSIFWATAWAFLSGAVTGYFLHSRFTFPLASKEGRWQRLLYFIGVAAIALLITETIMTVGVSLNWHYNLVKVPAVVVSVAWAFSASKWFVFAPSEVVIKTKTDLTAASDQVTSNLGEDIK